MPKMNTDETLRKDLYVNNEYPSWYYKKLKAIDIDDVIFLICSKIRNGPEPNTCILDHP